MDKKFDGDLKYEKDIEIHFVMSKCPLCESDEKPKKCPLCGNELKLDVTDIEIDDLGEPEEYIPFEYLYRCDDCEFEARISGRAEVNISG